jgi:hypothetical protein
MHKRALFVCLLAFAAVGAFQVAAASAATTGDIPDNQVFLTYHNKAAGYSIKYPEGWGRQGAGTRVTFVDKNNWVKIVIGKGGIRSLAVKKDLPQGAKITSQPVNMQLPGGAAVKVAYQQKSAPNPVTGKSVTLMVDRYYIAGKAGNRAVIDLATPVGVDNVDAFKLIAKSFHWQ